MLIMLMVSAVALAMTTATTASVTTSNPSVALLAVTSRLDTCGRGMGATGTSVPRHFVLDSRQGFPQFLTVNLLSRYGYTVLL